MGMYIVIQGHKSNADLQRVLDELAALEQRGIDFRLAVSFDDLFADMPDDKVEGVFIEGGFFGGQSYALEESVNLRVAPDGAVWAKIANSVRDLPDAA